MGPEEIAKLAPPGGQRRKLSVAGANAWRAHGFERPGPQDPVLRILPEQSSPGVVSESLGAQPPEDEALRAAALPRLGARARRRQPGLRPGCRGRPRRA